MVPIVADIFATIKNGFQEKALSMLKENARYLSKRDMYNLWRDPNIGVPMKEYLYLNCSGKQFVNEYLGGLSLNKDKAWAWTESAATVLLRHDLSAVQLEGQFTHGCAWGHIRNVKQMLARKLVDPSARNNAAIRCANMNGHIEIIKLLLKYDSVDPKAGYADAIMWAWEGGGPKLMKLLMLCNSLDPTTMDEDSFMYICESDDVNIAKLILTCDSFDNRFQDIFHTLYQRSEVMKFMDKRRTVAAFAGRLQI